MLRKSLKYTLFSFFYILTFLLFSGCGKEETNTKNHLPEADFEVKTDSTNEDNYRGNVNTLFHFDASVTKDVEDPTELLEVSWKFTSDGVYTEYSTNKTASYQYTETGLYFPVLKVRDTKGMVDSVKKMIAVVHNLDNQPPDKPKYLSPFDWEKYVGPNHVFKWSCTDQDSDTLIFDFWLSTRRSNLTLFIEDIETSKSVENGMTVYAATIHSLQYEQDYYWKIYARDHAGNYTPGDTWKFTTRQASE